MSDDIRPTPEDMARDLPAALDALARFQGNLLACSVYDIGAHRAAVRRALAAEAEIARLQGIVNGLSERVAGQSELLSKVAERDALSRLVAWKDAHEYSDAIAWSDRSFGSVWSVLLKQGDREVEATGFSGSRLGIPPRKNMRHVGTDERPATLAEVIAAALDHWAELAAT